MKKRRGNKKGYTLVELIVTFGMIALFIGASTMVLGVFSETFVKLNTVVQAQTVATTLMGTITSELGAAANVDFEADSEEAKEGKRLYCKTEDGVTAYYFCDYNHYSVTMYVNEDGHLQLKYLGKSSDGSSAQDQIWEYGDNVYNDFTICDFSVEKLGNTNCLTATIKLQSQKISGYTYVMKRSFECYNLETNAIDFSVKNS
jgi:type II secretory pathway pseudopilin PulG